MKTALLIALLFSCTLAVAQPTYTLDKIHFDRQHTNKVNVSKSGHIYVVKGKDKREVGHVNATGKEQDISSYFTAFTDKVFNDIHSTDSSYVFVATNGDFLLRFDGNNTKHLKKEHGLQNGFITSLAGRHALYLGNNLGIFNSQNQGFTQFAPTFLLNNPTIGMRYTERAEIFTTDRGLNFQYQHPPVMPHYCYNRSPFTHFIAPANLHYRTQNFGQGIPDTSHVYTAHHVVPYIYNRYSSYEMYHYVGTRTGLRRSFATSCGARIYLPRRRVYKLLEIRTYPTETFGTPSLEQRYLLSATDSGLYVNKILSNSRGEDTFHLVEGTSHLQIFDLDTDECYSKVWMATNQGLYVFSIDHQLENIKPQLSHNGVNYVCFSPSFRLTTIAKGFTTQWLKDGKPIPGATSTHYDATEPGTYQALLQYDCYNTSVSTAEVTLRKSTLSEAPISAEGNLVKCPDEAIKLSTPLRENYTYQWFRDGDPLGDPDATTPIFTTTEPGIYKVLVTNCNVNSVFSENIEIKNNDLPEPVISFATDRVCRGESIELSVQDYDGEIEWLLDGQPIVSDIQQPNKLIANIERSGHSYQVYSVLFTNEFGCTRLSDRVPIYFFAPPAVTIRKEPTSTVCSGASQRLYMQTNNWDVNISWSTGSTRTSISVTEPGDYSVTVTDRISGCSTTETVKVDFHAVRTLTVPTDTTICEAGLGPLLLTAGPSDMVYTLNGTPQLSNILTITKAGSYSITGTDKNGCISSSIFQVQNYCDDFVIPNIITPNGDNLNDWFIIQNLIPHCELKVFNRSGALVYQNQNYQNNWQGDKLPKGVYYYILHSTQLNKTWKGWLEINI